MKDYIIVFIACLVIVQVYVGEFILARYRAAKPEAASRPSVSRLLTLIVAVRKLAAAFLLPGLLGRLEAQALLFSPARRPYRAAGKNHPAGASGGKPRLD